MILKDAVNKIVDLFHNQEKCIVTFYCILHI